MVIRELNKNDVTQMLELMDEFWIKNQREELLHGEMKEIAALKNPKEQMQIELKQYFNWSTYVAEEGEEILGFISARISIEPDLVLDKIGIIEEFFVTERARGKKIGKTLMEKILEVLAQKGCVVYRTSAYFNNTIALSFYRRFGFKDEAIELSRKVVP